MNGARSTGLLPRFLIPAAALWLAVPGALALEWTLPAPRIPSVALLDPAGREVRLDRVVGDRPLAVSFFFTVCSVVCPPQTATLRDAHALLAGWRTPDGRRPLILSISVDPLVDTPAAVRDYARLYDLALGEDEGWLMLTGSPEALARVWASFGEVGGAREAHTGMIWFGRAGGGRWARASSASEAADVARYVREAGR